MAKRKASSKRRRTDRTPTSKAATTTRRIYGMLVGIGLVVALSAILLVVALRLSYPHQDLSASMPETPSQGTQPDKFVLPELAPATIDELKNEAESVAEELLSRFPKSPEAYQIMALLQKSLRQTDDARDYWKKCLEMAPTHTNARVGLAMVYIDQGKDRLAVETLQEELALGCSAPEIYNTLATALINLGEFNQTIDVLRRGLEAFPQSSKSWGLLGQAYIQQGDLDQAEASLKRAIELAPEYTDAHYALASLCARQGKHDAAIVYRKRFGELKARDRQMEDRLALVPDLSLVRQKTAATLCGAGALWLRMGDPAKADRLLLRAVAIAPGLPEPYKVLASMYQSQGRVADALLVQRRLVQVDPHNVVNYVNLANLLLRVGDKPQAEKTLVKAIETYPDAAIAYSCFAQLCMRTNKPEQARSLAQEWIRLQPTPSGYLLLASACRQLNDQAGAEAALQEMRELESNASTQPRNGQTQINFNTVRPQEP